MAHYRCGSSAAVQDVGLMVTAPPQALRLREVAELDRKGSTHGVASGTEVWIEAGRNNLTVVSAECAFYALFAIFPALSALISLYVLTTAPATVEDPFSMLSAVLPTEAHDIVIQQIRTLAESPNRTLGWSFVLFISLLADHRHCPLAAARAAGAWPASRALSLRALPAKSEMGVG